MISKQEFFRKYNRNSPLNPRRRIGTVLNRLIVRNLALHIAYTLARLGIRANAVTLLGLFFGLLGGVLVAVPGMSALVWAAAVYFLVDVLDNIDGQLARFQGTASKYGAIMDVAIGVINATAFAVALGFRVFFATGNLVYLILAGISGLIFVLEALWQHISVEMVGKFDPINNPTLIQKAKLVYIHFETPILLVVLALVSQLLAWQIAGFTLLEVFYLLYVLELFLTKGVYRFYKIYKKNASVPDRPGGLGWDDYV